MHASISPQTRQALHVAVRLPHCLAVALLMRVAVVLDAVHPYSAGGRETRYRHIVSKLSEQGHDVTYYTMNWWGGPQKIAEEGVNYQAIMGYAPLYKGERRSILHGVRFALACFRMLKYDFDVIEADHMPYLQLLPLRIVASVRRVPLVVTWHELWGSDYWRQYLGPLGVIAAGIERLTTRLPGMIIAVSPQTHDRLLGVGVPPERVVTVVAGVDAEKIGRAPTVPGFDLLFVGRLISHKGVDMVLDALSILQGRGISPSFGVVGVGPDADLLRRRVDELGLAASVTFLGHVQDDTSLYSLMKGSRLFLLPSTREGFGLVVVEAAAAGLPTVTVSHPDNYAQRLIIEGVTGWVCEPTPAALADAIVLGLRTPLDLSGYGATLLATHRWEVAGAQTAEAYVRAKQLRRSIARAE